MLLLLLKWRESQTFRVPMNNHSGNVTISFGEYGTTITVWPDFDTEEEYKIQLPKLPNRRKMRRKALKMFENVLIQEARERGLL